MLPLDETCHMVQDQTAVIRQKQLSDLILYKLVFGQDKTKKECVTF